MADWALVPTPTAIPATWRLVDVSISGQSGSYERGASPAELFRRTSDGAALLIQSVDDAGPTRSDDVTATTAVAAPAAGGAEASPDSERAAVVVADGNARFAESGTQFIVLTAGMNDADATALLRGLTRPAHTAEPNFEAPTGFGIVIESVSAGQPAPTDYTSAFRTYLIGADRGVGFFMGLSRFGAEPEQHFGVRKSVDGVTLFVAGNSIHRELDGFAISTTVVDERDRADIERALASFSSVPLGVWENEQTQLSAHYADLPIDLAVKLDGATTLSSRRDGPIVALCAQSGDSTQCRARLTLDLGGGVGNAVWADIDSSAGWVSAARIEKVVSSAVLTSTSGSVVEGHISTGDGFTLAGVIVPSDTTSASFQVNAENYGSIFTPTPPLL